MFHCRFPERQQSWRIRLIRECKYEKTRHERSDDFLNV